MSERGGQVWENAQETREQVPGACFWSCLMPSQREQALPRHTCVCFTLTSVSGPPTTSLILISDSSSFVSGAGSIKSGTPLIQRRIPDCGSVVRRSPISSCPSTTQQRPAPPRISEVQPPTLLSTSGDLAVRNTLEENRHLHQRLLTGCLTTIPTYSQGPYTFDLHLEAC